MIRFLDLVIASCLLVVLVPVMLVISCLIITSGEAPFFAQVRVGKRLKPFLLFKFRTMTSDAPNLPTHLISPKFVTPFGRFLRITKLDETPQLLNVLRGEMSLVGPRPNLMTQAELIGARKTRGIYEVTPGLTGLAQVLGVDMSNPRRLAKIDALMIARYSMRNYFYYIVLTAFSLGYKFK